MYKLTFLDVCEPKNISRGSYSTGAAENLLAHLLRHVGALQRDLRRWFLPVVVGDSQSCHRCCRRLRHRSASSDLLPQSRGLYQSFFVLLPQSLLYNEPSFRSTRLNFEFLGRESERGRQSAEFGARIPRGRHMGSLLPFCQVKTAAWKLLLKKTAARQPLVALLFIVQIAV